MLSDFLFQGFASAARRNQDQNTKQSTINLSLLFGRKVRLIPQSYTDIFYLSRTPRIQLTP